MGSSYIQQAPQKSDSTSIEDIESSIQGLVKSWCRKQRWQLHFQCCRDEQHEQEIAIKRARWRICLANFLQSTFVHVLALSLLLFDLILTVLDLSSSLVSCKRKGNEEKENLFYRWGGIAILCVLTAKALALAVALGTSFFRRPGNVVDGLVVGIALVLELFVKRDAAGLLVVVSLWRVVRVIESAFELSDEAIEAQIERIVNQFQALRDENNRLQESLIEKDKRIAELELELNGLTQAYGMK